MRRIFLFLALVATPSSFAAGRTLIVPTLETRAFHDFRRTVWGSLTGLVAPKPVMAGVVFILRLNNLSSVVQNGKIELVKTHPNAAHTAQASQCCPGRQMAPTIALCTNTEGTYKTGTGTDLAWPDRVGFRVDPNTSIGIIVSYVFNDVFSTDATTGVEAIGITVVPTMKITVDEDRGALQASMVRTFLGTNSYETCPVGGIKLKGDYGAYVSEASSGSVIMINGGRPF